MRIIGIDPGLRCLGWGVVDVDGSRLRHVANGICRSEGDALSERLLSLHVQLTAVVARHAPEAAAIEMTFVNRDGAGTLKLGQARGVAMLVPAAAGIPVANTRPTPSRRPWSARATRTSGRSTTWCGCSLPGADPVGPDAADALAIALCHAFHARSSGRLAQALAAGGRGHDRQAHRVGSTMPRPITC
jgi:crossover junction endodeoxyribonuclease RuvC